MAKFQQLHQVLEGSDGRLSVAIAGGPTFSRRTLQACIVDVSARLTAAGVKPGQVVCMAFANTVRRAGLSYSHAPCALSSGSLLPGSLA